VNALPNLSHLSHAEKDDLIRALWAQVETLTGQVKALTARVAELEARLGGPPKTPDNSSLPPSKGQKADLDEKPNRDGLRQGSIGRKGGGRALEAHPDETVIARPVCCAHCQAALLEADIKLSSRYDKIDLPPVKPVVTRVERFAGHCRNCGKTTLAPVPEGLEPGTPFSINIMAFALYLRFTHAISYKRLTNLMLELFGLTISEGALDAMFQRSKTCLDAEVSAILARLRRARVVYCDETGVRVKGKGCWNWVFQNTEVAIHVIRNSRGAGVVEEVMDGHRPVIWVSDLYGAQQGHADGWQVCLAHQLRDCQFAIEAGDAIFAPRMKMLLLRAYALSRRKHLADSTRRQYHQRMQRELDVIMRLAPTNKEGKRLRKRYGKVRDHLFTFLENPDIDPDNNSSERELRPTATYRKVTGAFRSSWGPDLYADFRSVVATARRRGIGALQAIKMVLQGKSVLAPG